jgi:hypothetical protein
MKRLQRGLATFFGVVLFGIPKSALADLKVEVNGNIRLDAQLEDTDTNDFPSPYVGDVPFEDDKERKYPMLLLDARQSRFTINASDKFEGIEMKARIECDFYTVGGSALSSNSRGPRLRQAYMQANHPSGLFILAGQTESLLVNNSAQPDFVDYVGPAGQIFAREPQLRMGYKLGLNKTLGDLLFEADIEKNSTENLGSDRINEAQGQGQMFPLYTGKISWLNKRFQLEGGIAATRNHIVFEGGRRAAANAFAVSASGQFSLGPVTFFGHYHYVDGLARLAYGDFATAFVVGKGLVDVKTDGFYTGATWKVSKNTGINGTFGWHKAREIPGSDFTGDTLGMHRSIHVNVIQRFWERWQVGLEYRRYDVEAFSGRKGHVNGALAAVWFFLK